MLADRVIAPGDRLVVGWPKVFWLYLMLVPALLWAPAAFTWPRFAASALLTFVTVGVGHSIGLHRGLIHRAYRCSRLTRGVLAYLAVQAGMGAPLAWIRVHHYRDYWQNQPDCPRYFAYRHSALRDYFWNLHLAFHPADDARYPLPAAVLHDRWLRWLDKTWYWHVLGFIALLAVVFGPEVAVVCGFARISTAILGHWFVNYMVHSYGYARYRIEQATESGYNDWLLGLLSFGEGFHNNHHAHPASAKLSAAWYEVDLGWPAVRLLQWLGLVWRVQALGHTPTQRRRARTGPLRWRFWWQK
ncbi:fatty acid desaturase [Hymenobacter jeollabukensis]|uniref:Acyl-CoA desaturase n=1 Tax=Hymenobacter jeollabukensis TaxID=2025313 RepID=A0A5R8WK07_9BACT|nr:acyl-CoA desaturase [Hymenobacter jeollabukensis]TLM89176.1 acyl-CoA desaturase [Hymenobacter jeollabukensis]